MILPTLLATAALVPNWTGEFVMTIKGQGRATGASPNFGTWKIDREARGSIALTKNRKGAGIARTPDSYNEERYEFWIAESRTPVKMRINDKVTIYGPLFSPKEIRDDLYLFQCPMQDSHGEWAEGKVGSPILQFDYQEGKFLFEAPRIYAKARNYFQRKFVKGPKKWTDTKPIVRDETELEFEITGALNHSDWYHQSGKFQKDQTEIVLTRKFDIRVNLGASVKAPKVEAEWTLVLRKQ